jgi:NAD(P)-dependent dehydrogenase (short-subunit alcohol dehydrogenase family)
VTRRRAQLTPPADLDGLFGLLKDNLGKAHAFINSAEYQMEQAPSGDDEEELRRQSDVEHLVEAGKLAVRAAIYTTEEIDRRRSSP